MDEKAFAKLTKGLKILIAVLIAALFVWVFMTSKSKSSLKQAANKGKIEVYKSQEQRAIEQAEILKIQIDSIKELQDSIMTSSIEASSHEIQQTLNKLFNNPEKK